MPERSANRASGGNRSFKRARDRIAFPPTFIARLVTGSSTAKLKSLSNPRPVTRGAGRHVTERLEASIFAVVFHLHSAEEIVDALASVIMKITLPPGVERAVSEHEGEVVWVKVLPDYDSLRSDARFTKLLERVNLG